MWTASKYVVASEVRRLRLAFVTRGNRNEKKKRDPWHPVVSRLSGEPVRAPSSADLACGSFSIRGRGPRVLAPALRTSGPRSGHAIAMAQPIKRTVGFAVAGAEAEAEAEEVQLAFSSDSVHLGEPSLEPGSPNPVLITPHFHGKNTVGSPQSGGGSQGDTRGVRRASRTRARAKRERRPPPLRLPGAARHLLLPLPLVGVSARARSDRREISEISRASGTPRASIARL